PKMSSGALPPSAPLSAPMAKSASGCGRPPPLCASMAISSEGRRRDGGHAHRKARTCFDSALRHWQKHWHAIARNCEKKKRTGPKPPPHTRDEIAFFYMPGG